MAFDLQRSLHAVVEQGGSDLHLKVPSQPLIRLHGELTPIEGSEPLSPADTERVLREMLTASERLAEFARDGEIDFSYTVRGLARFRVNAFRQRGSISIACRVVPFDIRGAEELGLPEVVTRLAERAARDHPRDRHHRLGQVDHARGDGRPHQPQLSRKNIVTIEDPIEYLHRDQRSVVHQREIGFDTNSFSQALRRVLRQDPDVILIGEMRDEETVGDGAQRRGDRAPRAQHAAHDRRGRDRQPHHRLLPAASPPAGARDAGRLAARRDLAATRAHDRRRRTRAGLRGADDDGPRAGPDLEPGRDRRSSAR